MIFDNSSVFNFQLFISGWGVNNNRSFPWRYSNDPYKVLASEFMLHRTRAMQVTPIYELFIRKYPSLYVFSNSKSDEIFDLLSPLGLTWRIEGMISAFAQLWQMYGEIPLDYEKLKSIKGIGQYIAGATLCFTLNKPYVLVDTNIVRVIGRVFGLDLSGEARRRKVVFNTIENVIDQQSPRLFYYSIIDLAHSICFNNEPTCFQCPLINLPCQYPK